MKAFKLFWKIFAVLSTIFVLGFFSYNLWDDYVRTGFSESPGYEWIANKMPEYEEQDRVVNISEPPSTGIRDIEAEIEAEMAEKDKENQSTENNETETNSESENYQTKNKDTEAPLNDDAEIDPESTENEELPEEEDSDNEELTEEEEEENSTSKIANNTSNCFNIVDGGMTCPKPEEIIYIEAESGKATIFLKERKKFFVAHSLSGLQDQMGRLDNFYKTKKYLINLDHLIAFIPKGQPNSTSAKIDLELIESKEIDIPYNHLNSLKAKYIQARGIESE